MAAQPCHGVVVVAGNAVDGCERGFNGSLGFLCSDELFGSSGGELVDVIDVDGVTDVADQVDVEVAGGPGVAVA